MITFTIDSAWNSIAQDSLRKKLELGVRTYVSLLNVQEPDAEWTIRKDKNNVNSKLLSATEFHTLEIPESCEWSTILHALYFVFRNGNSFGIDFIEEGIAAAISAHLCKVLQQPTAFDLEDYLVTKDLKHQIPEDPAVSIDQFPALLDVRYNLLAKYWLSEEEKNPGLLATLLTIKNEKVNINPLTNINTFLLKLGEKYPQISIDFANFWEVEKRQSRLTQLIEGPKKLFTIFYNTKSQSLRLVSWQRRATNVNAGFWHAAGFVEEGIPLQVVLKIEKNDGSPAVVEHSIAIDADGISTISLKDTVAKLGKSSYGYTLTAYSLDKKLAELKIEKL